MSRSPFDRLRGLASRYEAETPDTRAEQIAGRATARATAPSTALERLRAFASRYETATPFGRAGRIAARAVAVAQSGSPHVFWRRVVVAATVGATLSVSGFALGIVANRAVPGDLLYGVDRAYEAVGQAFGSQQPRTEERLVEALNLIDQGREADAVPLINEAVGDLSNQTGLPEVKAAYRKTLEGLTAPVSEPTGPTETTPVTSPSVEQAPATTVPPAEPVVAQPAADAARTLKLAVEALLRHVRAIDANPGGTPVLAADLTDSAVEVAAAAATVQEIAAVETVAAPTTLPDGTTTTPEQTTVPVSTTVPGATTITLPDTTPTTVAGDTTTSSTTTSSTTTTVPEDTTTTTTDGATSTPTTTTTTVPGDGSGDDGGDGGNPGPIILPPQP